MFKKGAYDPSMLKQLKSSENIETIKDRARYEGSEEIPKSDQTTMSAIEEEITNSCLDLRSRAKEDTENVLADQAQARSRLSQGCEEEVQQITARLDNDLYALKATRKPAILDMITRRIDSYSDMRCFKSKHQIAHRATYPENPLWATAILVTLLVVESMLNANMLAKTNIYGIIGGWAEAIFISLANIFFGFFAGMVPTRFSFYRKSFARNSARVGLAGSIAVIVFFNFMFAHYRLVGTPDVGDILTAAWESARNQPFAVFWDIKSFSLFIVGVTFSGLAAWKGFSWDDRYPFYGRIHRVWVKAKQDIIKERNRIIKDGLKLTRAAQKKLEGIARQTDTMATEYENSVSDSKAALKRYDEEVGRIEGAHSRLINVYRETNTEVRDTPAPAYFRQRPQMPDDDMVIDRDLSGEEQRAINLDAFSADMKEKINRTINALVEKEREIVEDLQVFFECLEEEATTGRVSAEMEADEDEDGET